MNKQLLTITPKSPMQKVKRLVELQAIYKEIKPEIDKLKEDLLKVTQDLDVLSLKTGAYTIYRSKKITPQVIDFKRLKKSLDKADIPYIVEEKFADQMKSVFKTIIEEGRELDGLEGLITEYVAVRLPKGGDKE